MKTITNNIRVDRVAVFQPGQPVKNQFQIALNGGYLEEVLSKEEAVVLRDLLSRAIEEEHQEKGGEK